MWSPAHWAGRAAQVGVVLVADLGGVAGVVAFGSHTTAPTEMDPSYVKGPNNAPLLSAEKVNVWWRRVGEQSPVSRESPPGAQRPLPATPGSSTKAERSSGPTQEPRQVIGRDSFGWWSSSFRACSATCSTQFVGAATGPEYPPRRRGVPPGACLARLGSQSVEVGQTLSGKNRAGQPGRRGCCRREPGGEVWGRGGRAGPAASPLRLGVRILRTADRHAGLIGPDTLVGWEPPCSMTALVT
ncbi:hypothetical protein ACVWZD_000860 [Streptomyces sp. TE3672]